jgi:hypothetical protein
MPENSKLEQRWGNGINVDKADLTQYIEWRISVYQGMTWKRAEDLVDHYADDFKDFTLDAFSACPLDVTVFENVVFTFEKVVEYKLPMNSIKRFTKIVHGQTTTQPCEQRPRPHQEQL